jgi:hypothetical protein
MRACVGLIVLASCRPATEAIDRDESVPDHRPAVIAPVDAAPCFRYVPTNMTRHATDCFPTIELACAAECNSVHICDVAAEDLRDNALAHPHAFGGHVVPMRAPHQSDGVLVSCFGW